MEGITMPPKRKDGRYQSSVAIKNPITGEKVKQYIYAYSLKDLEIERRRVLVANLSDFLIADGFHNFAETFLRIKRDVDKLEGSPLTTYRRFLSRYIFTAILPNVKITNVTPAFIKSLLARSRQSYTAGGLHAAAVDFSCSQVRAADREQSDGVHPQAEAQGGGSGHCYTEDLSCAT